MKPRDFIILAIVLVAGLSLYLLRPKSIESTSDTLYLQISIDGEVQELVPLTEEREVLIEQENGDYNIVQIYEGGFYMKESNCSSQDCVNQSEVTAYTVAERVLANQIICLPHKVVLTLVSEEEALQGQVI